MVLKIRPSGKTYTSYVVSHLADYQVCCNFLSQAPEWLTDSEDDFDQDNSRLPSHLTSILIRLLFLFGRAVSMYQMLVSLYSFFSYTTFSICYQVFQPPVLLLTLLNNIHHLCI